MFEHLTSEEIDACLQRRARADKLPPKKAAKRLTPANDKFDGFFHSNFSAVHQTGSRIALDTSGIFC